MQRLLVLSPVHALIAIVILIAGPIAGYVYGRSVAMDEGARDALLLSGRIELLRYLGVLDALMQEDCEAAKSRVKSAAIAIMQELATVSGDASAAQRKKTDDVLAKARKYEEALAVKP